MRILGEKVTREGINEAISVLIAWVGLLILTYLWRHWN